MTDERCTHDRYDKEYAAASGRCAICLVKEVERLRRDVEKFDTWRSVISEANLRAMKVTDDMQARAMNAEATIASLREAIQAVVDDLDSNDSEVCSREWFGSEPKVIVRLRNVLLPKETP